MARILGASLLSAVLVAACGAAVPTQPSSPGPTILASSAPSPTVRPSVDETPVPTFAVVCPDRPLSVSMFLATDPRCYVNADVTVFGWWDARRTDDPARQAELDHMIRGSMPFGAMNDTPEDFVFVDDLAVVPPAGWPGGAHWATVTGRRSPTNDRACHRDEGADITAPPHCPSYLIATRVVESAPPPAVLAGCITIPSGEGGSYVAVEEFTAFPPACSAGQDVTVRGWLDIWYVITGWESPWGIAPGWLWVPIGPWTVVAPDSNPTTSSSLLVYLDPARKIDVGRTNRWVYLTGHYADPKAQTCHIEYAGGYDPARDGDRIPDSFARRQCQAHFVVTAIEDATP